MAEKTYLGEKSLQVEIKTVVDATKTKVDTIDARTNTIDANVNTANASLKKLLDGRAVKSVQRGVILGDNTNTSKVISISNVVVDKCLIIINGVASSNGSTPIIAELLTNTSLTLKSAKGSWVDTITSWQVIEFY